MKKFSAAHDHFGKTRTLKLSFPCLIFAMRYQKLSPRYHHASITQESCKRTVQAFHLFQHSAVHPLLCNNNNITRVFQLQYGAPSAVSINQFSGLAYS